ncbi:MAG: hypothetical protein ACMG57_00360 [Candidatus Dojkabacteria bacterium]
MYFNYFTGIDIADREPTEFMTEVTESSIEKFEIDKRNNSIPTDIVIPDFYSGHFLTKRYSTKASQCQVRPDELYELCYTESNMLRQIILQYHGMVLDIVHSDFKTPYTTNAFHHFYLNTAIGSEEVIVEATLGQFLINYRGIFIGSRIQLKELFINALQKDPSLFNSTWLWAREFFGESPEKMFEIIWGSKYVLS